MLHGGANCFAVLLFQLLASDLEDRILKLSFCFSKLALEVADHLFDLLSQLFFLLCGKLNFSSQRAIQQ